MHFSHSVYWSVSQTRVGKSLHSYYFDGLLATFLNQCVEFEALRNLGQTSKSSQVKFTERERSAANVIRLFVPVPWEGFSNLDILSCRPWNGSPIIWAIQLDILAKLWKLCLGEAVKICGGERAKKTWRLAKMVSISRQWCLRARAQFLRHNPVTGLNGLSVLPCKPTLGLWNNRMSRRTCRNSRKIKAAHPVLRGVAGSSQRTFSLKYEE